MQRLGKRDIIIETYVGNDHRHLHRTTSGFQFGVDEATQIVTSVEDVKAFAPDVQEAVAKWLDQGGVAQAKKAQVDLELSEKASVARGTLDALADKAGPEIKAMLFTMLKQALEGNAVTGPTMQDKKVEKLEGGILVQSAGGNRRFIPDANIGDSDDEKPVLVGAGVAEAKDTMSAALEASKGKNKRT